MNTSFYQQTKISLVIFIGLIVLGSCQKSKGDDDKGCQINTAGLAGNYVLTSLKYKATATAPEQDYLIWMDPCEKDDIISLNTNGTYNYKDVGMVCSPDESESGTWSVNGNTIISDGIVAGTIEKFDCKSLVVYTTELNMPGDRLTITITKK